MSAGDDDECVFWCFEEKGGVGELWAGVAAAEVSCSALLCIFCSAPHHACANTIHSFGPGGDTGTNMEANSGEILARKRERTWG